MTRTNFTSSDVARGTRRMPQLSAGLGRIFFVLLLAFVTLGISSSFANAQSQMQLNKEACDEHKKADAEMNVAYQRIRRDYREDAHFIAVLKKAQLAWLRYRDAHVESIYPGAPSQYGSVAPMCRCMALAEITRARTQVLNRWVEGVEEGDVCAGSMKVK